ncbi:MAG: sulfatase-like hydrolase/transferase [Verrucomicrobia bacterium]|nr:sulfatase-like hydrolase/transferase [Verrucomicrobiota bacterium]
MNLRYLHFFVHLSLFAGSLSAKELPNVVIFYTDDQGTLDLNCYGANDLMTPNLDKLAEEGVRFTQAYAHTVCCPSRAALLTGRHPQRGGVVSWQQGDRHGSDSSLGNMSAEEITLAEVLKKAGYDTALFGKWHLGAKLGHGPLDQGFDKFWGHLSGFIDNYRHSFLHGQGYHDLYDNDKEIFRRGEYFPELLVEQALEYVDEDRPKPFFMMVAFNLPHYPEQPLGKFVNAYDHLDMPRRSYARVVSTVDDQIGRIIDRLDERGLRENTIIIYMSDNGHSTEDKAGIEVNNHVSGYPKGHYYSANGGGGYTGKWIGHKGTFLEGGVRVPAIISYPKKLPQGVVRDQIVTVMDWFPTVLELAEIETPDVHLDGSSMLQVINEISAPSAHESLHFGWQDNWAVREGDWKLIAKRDEANGEMLYSLLNLSDEKPEVKNYAKMKSKMVAHFIKLHEKLAKEFDVK